MTTVVNVGVGFIQPQYNDLREWCEDTNNVYVGKARIAIVKLPNGSYAKYPSEDSIWANQFTEKDGMTRDRTIQLYEQSMRIRLYNNPYLVVKLKALNGKRLGCRCHPAPCHADVLVKLIREYSTGGGPASNTNRNRTVIIFRNRLSGSDSDSTSDSDTDSYINSRSDSDTDASTDTYDDTVSDTSTLIGIRRR
ncbi:unnamed protein product [Sphagnum troendelagicum]